MSLPSRADVIVVGSGAAGSTIAAKLAEGGADVLILEAGPKRSPVDMVSSGIWARRLKWNGAPVLEDGANPVGYNFNAGMGVGGSAMHHYAVWPRMHPTDFRMRTDFDRGLDWPISYEELQPYYDLVQREAGISGDAEQENWRPAGEPYPMPPVPLFGQGRVLAEGFKAKGMNTAPLPLAVNTQPYNGRAVCLWDGWCDSGCPIGALANPATVYLPKAIAAGATLATETPVVKVLTKGGRTTGVEVVNADGQRQQVQADTVVLATFAVQNPRLMLASANTDHPGGLGNASGVLGRYLMSHSAGLVSGLFDQETQPTSGPFGGQLVNQDHYAKDSHAASGAFGSYQWMIAQAVRPNDLLGIATTRPDLFGEAISDFMRKAARGFAGMTAVVEDLPVADNRVTLSDRRDDHGVPLALATHTTSEPTNALWRATLDEGKGIFEAAGATEVWTGPQGAMHIMGGTIMGDDPATSVTDSYGRCHDIPNLVVAGPGLFPTSAGVNPTFTVQALAARSADHLLA
ncbi:MAG: GMC family oxidoreductase [Pseudomonadota bacterium]